MIVGSVNHRTEAEIAIRLRSSQGGLETLTAVTDTGFSGDLTLPLATIRSLGLTYVTTEAGYLADGSRVHLPVYKAIVIWDGEDRLLTVYASECAPLIGMGALKSHLITIEATDGGEVTVTRRS